MKLSSTELLASCDLLTHSIFGQHAKKTEKRSYSLQNMSIGYVSDPVTETSIHHEFENVKPQLNDCLSKGGSAESIVECVLPLVKYIQDNYSPPGATQEAIIW
jgi:hypothetical protein